MARRAADFGVAVGGSVSMDMKQVKARKDAVVGRSNRSIEQWLRGMIPATHDSLPRMRSPSMARCWRQKIFINVGGRAPMPDMPGLDQVEYLTNTSMLALDVLRRTC